MPESVDSVALFFGEGWAGRGGGGRGRLVKKKSANASVFLLFVW